jgi:excisionase family DNA binding protein
MHATRAPQLLTVPELAAALRVHPASIYRRIESGEIEAIRIGAPPSGRLRIPETELNRILESPSDRVSDDGSLAGGSFAGMNPAARRRPGHLQGEPAVEPPERTAGKQ